MKIVVLGTRGIPRIQGGVETHCENLYPRLVDLGCDVTIFRRDRYIETHNDIRSYKGVRLHDLFTPKRKSFEAIFHTFTGIIVAKRYKPDIVHIHAIGPSLLIPFARLLGMKVVMTHHGPDYDRQKWGRLAKLVLRLGERFGVRFANKVIVISKVIKDLLESKYSSNGKLELIHNGVLMPKKSKKVEFVLALGLEPSNYIVAVGRFVEEKGFHDLIEAYKKLKRISAKLVLVGDANHETQYSEGLKQHAKKVGVVLTGCIRGEKLHQIYSHAKIFVLPSYHEGLPIALLEAMSYNLDVLVSNIPANLEIRLKNEDYFKVGNVYDLCENLERKFLRQSNVRNFSEIIKTKYNWDEIAKKTLDVYKNI